MPKSNIFVLFCQLFVCRSTSSSTTGRSPGFISGTTNLPKFKRRDGIILGNWSTIELGVGKVIATLRQVCGTNGESCKTVHLQLSLPLSLSVSVVTFSLFLFISAFMFIISLFLSLCSRDTVGCRYLSLHPFL